MKKVFTLLVLSSFSLASADYYQQQTPNYPGYTCQDGSCQMNAYPSNQYQYPQAQGGQTYYQGQYPQGQSGQTYYQSTPTQGSYYQGSGQPTTQWSSQPVNQWGSQPTMPATRFSDNQYPASATMYPQSSSQPSSSSSQFQNPRSTSQFPSQWSSEPSTTSQPINQWNTQPNTASPLDNQYGNYPSARSGGFQTGEATRPLTDQEIAKDIHDALSSGWFTKGYQNVVFDINNGTVTLRGSVDTNEDKMKVEKTVRDVEGVRQVSNQIIVLKDKTALNEPSTMNAKTHPQDFAATESDKQINNRIRDQLKGGWFSKGYETLVIRTTNGMVIITGSVDKFDDIEKINSEVKKINGVRSVNNQLSVKNQNR